MTRLRLLTLNTWGGRVCQPLLELIRRLALEGTEVFCFQEVYDVTGPIPSELAARAQLQPNLLTLLHDALPGYEYRFTANCIGFVFDGDVIAHAGAQYGNAIFVRRDLPIESYQAYPTVSLTYTTTAPGGTAATYSHFAQVVQLRTRERSVQIANFHGIAEPGDKLDTPTRLVQSERLLQALPTVEVLCGDFNLHPHTTSIALLEERWRNLIQEFEVPTTRSRLSPYWGTPQEQRHADYVFVRDDLTVDQFRAIDDEVSDHLALRLEARITSRSS